ncbi:hypothetical protein FIBSPDRAFT_939073 [Athelia psychrophila]|uniref:DUF6534 domain-containing protein n=1 Tax=Athelia psychrophila TaxID=1759441 RepID=A0A165X7Q6_9AGAM|nr:hypothetical protein FIBSPDRAFT_939073 [Fibularhizoctonia sp. CBS 109695]
MAAALTIIPKLDGTLGAIEVGTLISCFLYGVTTVQVYIYYSNGTVKDPLRIRLLVPFIWLVETIQTVFMCAYLYRVTVTYYGNVAIIGDGHWTLNTSALFDGLVGGLVQGFFAHRIWILSKKWPITLISWTGSFLAFTGTVAIMILGQISYIAKFDAEFTWLVTTTLALLLSVDIINTVALCSYLRIERTGFQSTDGMLNKLFIWTLETGLFTSLGAMLMLIFSLALPETTIWIGISAFYGKLYSNSLMASLNAREALRSLSMANTHITSSRGQQNSRHLQVSVMQTRTEDHDDLELAPAQEGKVPPLGSVYDHYGYKAASEDRDDLRDSKTSSSNPSVARYAV